jgi:ribosomal protein S18 acetylase RimI-like enzyme
MEAAPLLTLSEVDSMRFGLRVARGHLVDDPELVAPLLGDIQQLGVDIAIFRLPAGSIHLLRELNEHGLTPIHADTLVYHTRDLCEPIPDEQTGRTWSIGPANADDSTGIAAVARQSFATYRSHYHANPLLNPALIAEGYAEWAISFIRQNTPDLETWVARQAGRVIAFATCRLAHPARDVEIVLNAVAPEYAGQGVYGSLLRHMLLDYRERHFQSVRISTQIWNYRVQRAWARAGFRITHAYDTYHVNALPDLSDAHQQDTP